MINCYDHRSIFLIGTLRINEQEVKSCLVVGSNVKSN